MAFHGMNGKRHAVRAWPRAVEARVRMLATATATATAIAVTAGLGLFSAVARAAPANAVTLYVTNDPSSTSTTCTQAAPCGTLQEAITAAEADSNTAVTVDVAAATYTHDTDDTIDLPDTDTLDIEGAGAASTIVQGDANEAPIVTLESGTVTIDSLTITGNTNDDDASPGGGGISIESGSLTADYDTFSGDNAEYGGGGIANLQGTVTADYDTFSNDEGVGGIGATRGGGIYNAAGLVTADHDTFSNDSASDGGGIFSDVSVTADDDTFTNDDASIGGGGGIANNFGSLTAYNDTFFSDSASGEGGGVESYAASSTLVDDTFSDDSTENGIGGGIAVNSGAVTLSDSILDSAPCRTVNGGTVSDGDYNVVDSTSNNCGLSASGDDLGASDNAIDLATALAANGSSGPETLAIGPGSAAFEEVPSSACSIATDERGFARPGAGGQTSCDAGAFELQTLTQGPPMSAITTYGTQFTTQLTVANAAQAPTFSTVSGPVAVSSTGLVSAPSTTSPGTYTVTGTDSDALGATGTWTFTLTVTRAPTTLVAAPARFGLLWVMFSAKLTDTDTGASMSGEPVAFSVQNQKICQGTTNGSGVASCTVFPALVILGRATYTATYAGDSDYVASSSAGKL